jgi:hypothetical protein
MKVYTMDRKFKSPHRHGLPRARARWVRPVRLPLGDNLCAGAPEPAFDPSSGVIVRQDLDWQSNIMHFGRVFPSGVLIAADARPPPRPTGPAGQQQSADVIH